MKITLITFSIYGHFFSFEAMLNYFSVIGFWIETFINGESYTSIDDLLSLDVENWPITIIKFFFIPFLLLVTISVTLLLIRNQYMSIKLKKKKQSIDDEINTLLTDIIFNKRNDRQIAEKIKAFKLLVPFGKKWCQNYLLHKILEINQTFQIDSNLHQNIYKLFGFDKISNRLLRHKKWYLKSLGIYRLQRMHDWSKRNQIRPFLKDNNPEVKSNALIALITLSPEKFAALRDYDEPLTKADEMKILDIIYESSSDMPKNSEKLLDSKNISIVVLGIKLMVQYKVKFSFHQMDKLIRFSNLKVRREAIKAVGKLKMFEAKKMLVDQYRVEQDKKVKINILRSLKSIGDHEAAIYLESILAMESDSDIQFEIVDCINSIDPAFFENYYNTIVVEDNTIKNMALHVKDPYLV